MCEDLLVLTSIECGHVCVSRGSNGPEVSVQTVSNNMYLKWSQCENSNIMCRIQTDPGSRVVSDRVVQQSNRRNLSKVWRVIKMENAETHFSANGILAPEQNFNIGQFLQIYSSTVHLVWFNSLWTSLVVLLFLENSNKSYIYLSVSQLMWTGLKYQCRMCTEFEV